MPVGSPVSGSLHFWQRLREDFIAELAEKGINIYEKVERRLA